MQGFTQISNTVAIPGDRIQHGASVYDVLLTRDDHVVARNRATKEKARMPLQFNVGGMMMLFRREGLTVEVIAVNPVKTVSTRPNDKPTKLTQCREIFAANPLLPKADVLKMFVEQAACTQQGANTYYCLLKKQAA